MAKEKFRVKLIGKRGLEQWVSFSWMRRGKKYFEETQKDCIRKQVKPGHKENHLVQIRVREQRGEKCEKLDVNYRGF